MAFEMNLGIAPVGDFVGLAVPGQQGIPLLILENHQGLPASGAMDAHPSHLETTFWTAGLCSNQVRTSSLERCAIR